MSNEMIDKLKDKIEEIDEKRFTTESEQKKLIEISSKFNEKIRTFVEYHYLEKSAYNEGLAKIQAINVRIKDCNSGIGKIKDKLNYINSKLEKKQNLLNKDNSNQ